MQQIVPVRLLRSISDVKRTTDVTAIWWLQAMFGGQFTERRTSKVTLNEIASVTLRLILQYLYSGELLVCSVYRAKYYENQEIMVVLYEYMYMMYSCWSVISSSTRTKVRIQSLA